jgi:hypothetical protein
MFTCAVLLSWQAQPREASQSDDEWEHMPAPKKWLMEAKASARLEGCWLPHRDAAVRVLRSCPGWTCSHTCPLLAHRWCVQALLYSWLRTGVEPL